MPGKGTARGGGEIVVSCRVSIVTPAIFVGGFLEKKAMAEVGPVGKRQSFPDWARRGKLPGEFIRKNLETSGRKGRPPPKRRGVFVQSYEEGPWEKGGERRVKLHYSRKCH